MEPKLPATSPSPEMGPPPGHEVSRQGEQQPQRTQEQQPRVESREQQPGAGGSADPAAALHPLPPLPVPVATQVPTVQPADDISSDNPLHAGDEDLIEKEWVDKAKKIVERTREDPYQQEKEVSRLQADYLSKRYGKSIKVAND